MVPLPGMLGPSPPRPKSGVLHFFQDTDLVRQIQVVTPLGFFECFLGVAELFPSLFFPPETCFNFMDKFQRQQFLALNGQNSSILGFSYKISGFIFPQGQLQFAGYCWGFSALRGGQTTKITMSLIN